MPIFWIKSENGQIPPEAVPGGKDPKSGETYYVGRTMHDGRLVPGKVQPSSGGIYIANLGVEYHHQRYEVMVNPQRETISWEEARGKNIPTGAIPAGQEEDVPTFVGRHKLDGSLVVGKVYPKYGRLYVPFAGKEHDFEHYEVLTYPVRWEQANGGMVPENAILAGEDSNGVYYVGRAMHNDMLIPGKVSRHYGGCFVSYGGQEFGIPNYQVLVSVDGKADINWVKARNGEVPDEAVHAGWQEGMEPLYVARHHHRGNLLLGKLQPSHGRLYVPYDGREESFDNYEVLTVRSHMWKSTLGWF